MIYYPVPAHQQKMFAHFDDSNIMTCRLPIGLTERVISLPMHTELDEEQLRFITAKVLELSLNIDLKS